MFSNEQLISPDFDEVAYLRYALRASSYNTEHSRLESCIAEVKKGIRSTLAEHADGLIGQARCTYKTQCEIAVVRRSTDSLKKASGRLRMMIEEPYMQLQSRVRELEATHEAMHLLQATLRFLSLAARLQEQLSAAPAIDLVRASYTLRELEDELQDGAIRSLQVVDAQMPIIERHATTIRTKTHDLLTMSELTAPPNVSTTDGTAGAAASTSASTSRLATQVSTGLQCSYILRMLSRSVNSFMTERRREVLRTIMRELDAQAIEEHISREYESGSRYTASGQSGTVSEQAVTAHIVLQHIQKTLFIALQHTQCIILLWRLLLQRRDPNTQELYLSSIDSPVHLLVEYWLSITDKLRERLSSLQKRYTIRVALASAYPRYYRLVASFLSRTNMGLVSEGSVHTALSNGAVSDLLGNTAAACGVGTTTNTAAAALLSIHVAQCGMGDYLDLIDVVDAATKIGVAGREGIGNTFRPPRESHPLGHGEASAPAATDTQELRHTWLTQVCNEARDAFRMHVLDRHREVITGVFSRLSSLVPLSVALAGQPAAVVPVRMQDGRRPIISPQANTLDMAVYTRLVLQEVHTYHQDPHTLEVLMDCILSTLRQVRAKLVEAVRKYPLPPLPAVTAAPTAAQVMHLSIANGCTTLALDCATVLSMMPHFSATLTGGGEPGAGGIASITHAPSSTHRHSHHDPYMREVEQLATKRMELQDIIYALQTMSEQSTKPFADSAVAVLLPTVTQVMKSVLRNELARSSATVAAAGVAGGGDSRTALMQLQAQCCQFTDRFFFLVDPRTSGWVEACHEAADRMLARLVTQLVVAPPPLALRGSPLAIAPAYAHTLQVIMPPLLHFVQVVQSAGAVGRTTSLLRGCVRQMEGFYEVCGQMTALEGGDGASEVFVERLRPPIPPFLAMLLVLQYGVFSTISTVAPSDLQGAVAPPALATALGMSEQGMLECLECILLSHSMGGASAGASNKHSSGAPAAADTEANRMRQVLAAIDNCFRDVVTAAPKALAARLQALWTSIQGG